MADKRKTSGKNASSTPPPPSMSQNKRVEMAATLGAVASRQSLTETERDEAHALLEELSGDAEVRVRAAVSRAISQYPLLPQAVAQKLAQDVLDVAGPVLENSPVLSDGFLIKQINCHEGREDCQDEIQVKIAKRARLPASVSDVLLKSGVTDAVETVLSNKTACIDHCSLQAVLQRDDLTGTMMTLVSSRPDLSEPTVTRCHEIILAGHFDRKVGCQVRKRLIEKYALPPKMADAIVQAALEDALSQATLEAGSPEDDLELLAKHLKSHGDLTASLVLRMVCTGSLDFPKTVFRVLTGRPREEISIAFFGAGTDMMADLYRKSELDPYFRFALTTAIRTIAEAQNHPSPRPLEKLVADIIREIVGFYRGISPSSIEHVIVSLAHEADRWRQPDTASKN